MRRAIRKRYFPRSVPGSLLHAGKAFCAAWYAASTSAWFASAIWASTSSVAGLMDSKYLPDLGGTNLPPMKRSYFDFSFGSAVSGAGSYSHRSPNMSCGTELVLAAGRAMALGVVMSVALRGLCEVVGRLVCAGLFFFDLSQQVVQQR